MRRLAAAAVVGSVAALVGCAGTAPTDAADARVKPEAVSPASSGFEQQYRDRAASATRQGKLAEAALAWEVLTVLRPQARDAQDALASTRRQIDAAVAERLPRAAQAQRRGDLDGATQHYLAVLVLQPDSATAADALRSIERERVKRQQLGRASRLIFARRVGNAAAVAPDKAAAAAATTSTTAASPSADRNELEHATILARQGEIDTAIGLLEKRVAANRNDRAALGLLADLYERKAEDLLAARNTTGAIDLLEKSLRLAPGDARVVERLRQLRTPAAPKPADAKGR